LFGQGVEVDLILFQPFGLRVSPSKLSLNVSVVNDDALLDVYEEHTTRLESPLGDYVRRLHVQHAYL
jgi:hypothetical protein